MNEDESNDHKKFIIGFSALHLINISLIIYIFFTVPETGDFINLLKAGLVISILAIAFNIFLFKTIFKSKPQISLGINILLLLSFFSLFLDLTGGIYSNFLIIFYLALFLSFMYSETIGIMTIIFILGYLSLDLYLYNRVEILLNPISIWPQALLLTLITIFAYILNSNLKKIREKLEKTQKENKELTSGQSKDKALLSGMADGVYVVDKNRKVVLFNKAAEEMTGWTDENAIGIKCWTVMKLRDEKDIDVCKKSCPMFLAWNSGDNVVRDDLCFINRRKKTIKISGSYASIKDSEDNITGGICVFRDVTKRKEVERLRNEFISTASHELRTPITTLEGYLTLIGNPKICKIDKKTQEYTDKAHTTCINMSILVRNLLSVTKIEEQKLQANIKPFDLKGLISNTVSELKMQNKNPDVQLEFQESSISFKGKKSIGRSLKVVADSARIKEILVNLIENGLKFTKEGYVKISIQYDDDFATVSIEDTGTGIAQDDIKHLFEKFYRVDNSTTRETGGTGLGLYITRAIVEMFGGKIWMESKVGKGSKFFFTLPRSLD